ncbi:MAG: Ribosomal RNA small subunit methyltransferase G [Phycisphaerae bacterium]|nr:Ribosomal RNA small subunit methyltransferase G [Phycisphaerae bacterium]
MTDANHVPTEFLQRCGVDLTARPIDTLRRLHANLVAANQQANLTRITDERDYWIRHVADSLAIGLAWPAAMTDALRVADVGCGAGFPALPLAWANPRLEVVGIESHRRKADFVAAQAAELGLANCRVIARQAREAARMPEASQRFDAVLLRAVAEAGRMIRDCRELLRPGVGARIVHYKTPVAVAEEMPLARREADKFGFSLETSDVIALPGGAGERQFLICMRRD